MLGGDLGLAGTYAMISIFVHAAENVMRRAVSITWMADRVPSPIAVCKRLRTPAVETCR